MKIKTQFRILLLLCLVFAGSFFITAKSQATMSFGGISLNTNSVEQGTPSITMSGTFKTGFSSHNCTPNIDQEPRDNHVNRLESMNYEVMFTSIGGQLNEFSDWLQTFEGVSSTCNSAGAEQAEFQLFSIDIPVGSLAPGDYQIRLYGTEWMEHGVTATPDPLASPGSVGFSQSPVALSFTVTGSSSGTIVVNSNQATCWTVSGPDSRSGCGYSATYPSMPLGTYNATADDLTCYSKDISYNPGDRNLVNGGTLYVTITYNPNCGEPELCTDSNANNFGDPLPCTYDPPGCSYSIAPTSQNFGYNGGTGTIQVTTTSSCSWTANSNNSFISITSGSSGTGNGTISYSVSANGSTSSRNGSINAAGNNFSISQDGAPGAACSDDSGITVVKGLKATYTPGETDTYTLRVSNTGSSWWYHGTAYQFVQLTNMSISPSYGQISPGVPSGNTSDYREFTFNFTAPSSTGSYNLRMQMVHRAGWNYQRNDGSQCLAAPGSDTYFGNQYNASFNVQPSTGPQIVFTLVYTPIPPNTPFNVTVDNSVCSKITVNWSFNGNGVEDGFRVYRSTDGTTWTDISGVLPVSARSYQDTPPQFNVRYYYMVRAKKSVAGNAESPNSNVADALNVACVANLNPSSMALTRVNGVNYTSSTQIKNGDILTYEIVIRNVGTDDAGIQRICVNPGSNLSNATNLSVTGPGSSNGGISTNNAQCISDGNSGLRFNVTGNKDRINHWYITYNTTFTSTTPVSTQETITNSAVIYFTDDAGAHQKTVSAGAVIIDTSKPKVPTFREVAP